ncbi:GDYXXLXY domain-containing protein [Ramlibacter sp. Leaf400]|uniref:GDYXXLXY domain-containing protein n=1 Tax=Ramlibacter sp. Leaf400 TaxID=1736365 RepID=UPI0006F5A6C0|nr:GDYXXLXY domain-containing protein [Ramlibacter sp. Leaf400]KQT13607.1 hypothetical protein ASG30_19515 [Ramlibacter sp. Leaf400]
MNEALTRAVRAGVARGLLPREASATPDEGRPWPVVLLTALGAWLAAIPLLGFFGALLGPLMTQGVGAYVVGVAALGGAAALLRSERLPVFVEQLAFPLLLVGGGSLAMGLYRDLPHTAASVLLLAVCVSLAVALRKPWLRLLLGALGAGLVVALLHGENWSSRSAMLPMALALQAALLVWAAALGWQQSGRAGAESAAVVESFGAGWAIAVLAGLAAWSGMTFLVGGSLGFWGELAGEVAPGRRRDADWPMLQAASVVFAAAGAAWAARRWPELRTARSAGVALVLIGLSGFLPALGGVLFALSLTATSGRARLAAVAGLAAAWILGSFYYQLQWPLAQKAVVLAGAGALLAALAWRAGEKPEAPPGRAAPHSRTPVLLATFAAIATLAVANFAIWQKEDLIAHGRKVYVQLAPVDPRSLMQGDFMRLNWPLPDAGRFQEAPVTLRRPQVVATLDARGVAQLLRVVGDDSPRAPGEIGIELTPRGGRWMIVTDAWFFREGDAERWQRARYGEFRVLPDGRALLVGLADERLQPIPSDR